jgi:hypothetical protein
MCVYTTSIFHNREDRNWNCQRKFQNISILKHYLKWELFWY